MTINERLGFLIESLGMSLNAFAKTINTPTATIRSVAKGGTKPGYDILERILKAFPSVNPSWLLLEEGGMYKEDKAPKFHFDRDEKPMEFDDVRYDISNPKVPDIIISQLREQNEKDKKHVQDLKAYIELKEQLIIIVDDMIERYIGVYKKNE